MQITEMKCVCVPGAKSLFWRLSGRSSTSLILKPDRSEQQTCFLKLIFSVKNMKGEERCYCTGASGDISVKYYIYKHVSSVFQAKHYVFISSQKTQRRSCQY